MARKLERAKGSMCVRSRGKRGEAAWCCVTTSRATDGAATWGGHTRQMASSSVVSVGHGGQHREHMCGVLGYC